MNISVYIDRLILDGLSLERGAAAQLQAAVVAELTRLLAESQVAPALQEGGAAPMLRAAPIQLAPDGTPAQVGAQIAQAVYGSFGT
jgi:hypothetical protein